MKGKDPEYKKEEDEPLSESKNNDVHLDLDQVNQVEENKENAQNENYEEGGNDEVHQF